jgi:hypothetical protein
LSVKMLTLKSWTSCLGRNKKARHSQIDESYTILKNVTSGARWPSKQYNRKSSIIVEDCLVCTTRARTLALELGCH